ncbi:MAG: LysE family translocator [Chloroflexia bacterium]|nr:LysE family translocator [Chloroflexia bacterium]
MPDLVPFLAVAVVLIIVPGPDMALVTRNALLHGRRAALMTAIGVSAGLLGWTLAAAVGVAAVLRASAVAFDALRLVGAAYLIVLGVQAFATTWSHRADASGPSSARSRPLADRAALRQGLLSNLLNPKIAVFFTGFLPQFIAPASPALPQSLVLGGVFVLLTLGWLAAYACLTARAGGVLQRPRVRVALQRVTGVVLIGFGLRLATERR